MEEKLVNFHLDSEIYHDLKMLALRENRTVKDILREEIEDYIKVHKEGNPQHLISKFMENEDFIGFPSIAIDKILKENYIKKNCIDENGLNEFGNQLWGHVTQWYYLIKEQ